MLIYVSPGFHFLNCWWPLENQIWNPCTCCGQFLERQTPIWAAKGKITSTFNRFYDWSYETEHPQQTIVFTKSQPRERTLLCHDSICWRTGLRKSLTKMISGFHVIHEQILTFKVYSILFLVIITKPKLQLELQSLTKASLCLHLNTGVKVPVSAFLCRGSYQRLDKFTVRGTYFFFFGVFIHACQFPEFVTGNSGVLLWRKRKSQQMGKGKPPKQI